MNKYHSIVCDLDGTLLDDTKKISEYNLTVINRSRSMGMKMHIASGRHFDEIKQYVEQIGLSSGEYIICCDGLYIVDSKGTVIWENNFLNYNDVILIASVSMAKTMVIVTNDVDYCIKKNIVSFILFSIGNIVKRRERVVLIKRNLKSPINHIEKIILFSQYSKSGINKINEKYTIHNLFDSRLEITNINTNKYTALHYLEKERMINIRNTIYFGDDNNDLECFKNITTTVAPANATRIIKDKALFLGPSNNEDFVGKMLEQLL